MAKVVTAERIGRTTLELRQGNITKVAADVIVNAANASLSGGGGVDGWIHRIGGPSIMAQCRIIGGCPTGEAVVTGAGDLLAKYVVHAVAPRYSGKPQDAQLLRSAYANALLRAEEVKAKSIAFPSLGTGAYGYPIEQAAPIAVDTVRRHLGSGRTSLELVMFVLFTEHDYDVYRKLFPTAADPATGPAPDRSAD
jgi:O-acetyl-ADP-ribose deacetylase (regulator of RNase III)